MKHLKKYEEIDENNQYDVSNLIDCLPCLRKVRSEIGFNINEMTSIVHEWFDENDIDYIGMSDLDMYIAYIEGNMKNDN